MKFTIVDFCRGAGEPVPDGAAGYGVECMSASDIKEFYGCKFDPKNEEFWKIIWPRWSARLGEPVPPHRKGPDAEDASRQCRQRLACTAHLL